MSGIETFEGKATFVSARVTPYHRLGTVTDHTMTADEALELAHLKNWNVRKEPLAVVLPDGTLVPTGDSYGTIRDNPFTGEVDFLGGKVGAGYTPVQNEEHTALLDALVDESGAHIEVAGALNGGKQVFVSMKMPNHMMIGGVDGVDTYISALNSHDGRSAFRFIVSPVRIECTNTQAAAIRNAQASFSIRHTKNVGQAMIEARHALDLTFKYIDGFQAEAEKMIQESITEAAFNDIVKDLLGDPEKQKGAAKTNTLQKSALLTNLFLDSPTAQTIKGTRWGAYQAVTEYVDFFAPVRGARGGDIDLKRATRAISADGVEFKSRAFELLTV